MPWIIGVAAAAVSAALVFALERASARRRIAEQRVAMASELAAAKRDNEWM
jgi:hypothetical protein